AAGIRRPREPAGRCGQACRSVVARGASRGVGRTRLWRGPERLRARLCPRGLFRRYAVNRARCATVSSYARRTRYSERVRCKNREPAMPEIYVHAVKGRSLDQKRALIKDITDAVVKNFSVP